MPCRRICDWRALCLFNAGSTRETSQYRSYDPGLTIAGESLQFLGSDNFKYLGRPVNCDLSEHLSRQSITSDLISMLNKTQPYQCLQNFGSTNILWLQSWQSHYKPTTCAYHCKRTASSGNKSLKRWAGLPRCANPSILFVGNRNQTGLRVKSLTTLWKQQQHVKFNLLQTSLDPRCKSVAAVICKRREHWSRKFPPTVLAEDCHV